MMKDEGVSESMSSSLVLIVGDIPSGEESIAQLFPFSLCRMPRSVLYSSGVWLQLAAKCVVFIFNRKTLRILVA
jgi:hypothetical protein